MEVCLPVYDVHLALGQPSARPPEESTVVALIVL